MTWDNGSRNTLLKKVPKPDKSLAGRKIISGTFAGKLEGTGMGFSSPHLSILLVKIGLGSHI